MLSTHHSVLEILIDSQESFPFLIHGGKTGLWISDEGRSLDFAGAVSWRNYWVVSWAEVSLACAVVVGIKITSALANAVLLNICYVI